MDNNMNAKEYLESKGYEFPDKDFWMEDYVTDHKFKDLVQLMEDYAQQKLNIASVSGKRPDCVKCGMLSHPILGAMCAQENCPDKAACASGAVDKTVSVDKNEQRQNLIDLMKTDEEHGMYDK